MNVFVFKTSLHPEHIRHVNSILRSIIPECVWSYDLEDCDRILRIESREDIAKTVCFHLKIEGFQCRELGRH